jgi:hypothetical protein
MFRMSSGRYAREVLAPLLSVLLLTAAGCGDEDASNPTSTPDRESGASASPDAQAEIPADEEEVPREDASPREEASPRKDDAPVVGPTRAKIMRRLDARRIRVDGKRVPIDLATLACGRAGTKRAGGRRTIRLSCVQPTFPAGSVVGPDAIFFVHPTPRGRLVITNARFTSY